VSVFFFRPTRKKNSHMDKLAASELMIIRERED